MEFDPLDAFLDFISQLGDGLAEIIVEYIWFGLCAFFIGTWRIFRHPRQSWRNGLWNTYKQAWQEKLAKKQAQESVSPEEKKKENWKIFRRCMYIIAFIIGVIGIIWLVQFDWDTWQWQREQAREQAKKEKARRDECKHFGNPRVLFINGERIWCN